jgi:hypothetical protein
MFQFHYFLLFTAIGFAIGFTHKPTDTEKREIDNLNPFFNIIALAGFIWTLATFGFFWGIITLGEMFLGYFIGLFSQGEVRGYSYNRPSENHEKNGTVIDVEASETISNDKPLSDRIYSSEFECWIHDFEKEAKTINKSKAEFIKFLHNDSFKKPFIDGLTPKEFAKIFCEDFDPTKTLDNSF